MYFLLTARWSTFYDMDVNVDVSGGASFIDTSEYEVPDVITIGSGDTTAWLILFTEDDTVDEPDDTITAQIQGGSGYVLGNPSSASITVNDNDLRSLDPPTGLYITVDASDDDSLDVNYTRSESPHYYQFELHRSDTQSGTYTALTSLVNDWYSSPANFDNQTKGYWYKARGRNCHEFARTNCGDYGDFSSAIHLKLKPPTNLGIAIESGDYDNLDVSYTRSESPNYYQFELHRSSTEGGTYTALSPTVIVDDSSPANFNDQSRGYWYKARGRNCRTSQGVGCGDWSGYTGAIELLSLPDVPTLQGIDVNVSDDDKLDVSYDEGEDLHYYEIELHRSETQSGSYTALTPTVIDSFSPAEFDGRTKGYWYKARGRECNYYDGTNATDCGAWSGFTGAVHLMLKPPTDLTISVDSALEGNLDVSYTQSESPHYYQFQLHQSDTQGGTYTALTPMVNDSVSPADFNGQTRAKWYKAWGRNCRTSSRTGCGDWSELSDPVYLTFVFDPNPLALGDTSDFWSIPVDSPYLDVDFSAGSAKDSQAGDVRIIWFDTNFNEGTLLVDAEGDSGPLPLPTGSLIMLHVEVDAFDASAATVTLNFHSGSDNSGPLLATATIQKEARPADPVTGGSSTDTAADTVTLTWYQGNTDSDADPHHYQVVIPDTANPGTNLYDEEVAQPDDSTAQVSYTITGAAALGLTGSHTAQVWHCNEAGGCSLNSLDITFAYNPVFQFTPDPMVPGDTSTNNWGVPSDVSTVYLDVDFSIFTTKDAGSGVIRVYWIDTSKVTHSREIDGESDSATLTGIADAVVWIEVENDAFDRHGALVTLSFHSGSSSGAVLAQAKVQKEARLPDPERGTSSSDGPNDSVTLNWYSGTADSDANPDHYELEILDPDDPNTVLYQTEVAQAADPATQVSHEITGASSYGLLRTLTAKVWHCNQAGGCSESALPIQFTHEPYFLFDPDPIVPGQTSTNTWTVPADASSVYLDVEFDPFSSKDTGSGFLNVYKLPRDPASTAQVHGESNRGPLNWATAGSEIQISVDSDAFDVDSAKVTLTFHSGSSSSGKILAQATVQKEVRPEEPINGGWSADAVAEPSPSPGTRARCRQVPTRTTTRYSFPTRTATPSTASRSTTPRDRCPRTRSHTPSPAPPPWD